MKRYNLPLNNKYTFISITDQGEGNFQCCDNCGTLIRYICHIKDISNKNYFVGTECVKTLQKAEITNEYSMNEQIRAFKKLAEMQNLIKTNNALKVWRSKSYIIAVGLNKNLKPLKCVVEKLFDPFLGTTYPFIESFFDKTVPIGTNESEWCFNDIFEYFNKLRKNVL